MSKSAEIREFLSAGVSKAELVRRGYSRGSVYKEGRQLAKDGQLKLGTSAPNSSDPRSASEPLAMSPSADPEIAQLQKEIQRARLEVELNRVRGDAKTVGELEQELARLQEWTVAMIRALGEGIEFLAGNEVDAVAFEDFEQQALAELRGSGSRPGR